jgi:hypothetical protein
MNRVTPAQAEPQGFRLFVIPWKAGTERFGMEKPAARALLRMPWIPACAGMAAAGT